MPTAHVNASHKRTVWAPANKDAPTAAAEREPLRSPRDIEREMERSQ
jgi:hypothetical protein